MERFLTELWNMRWQLGEGLITTVEVSVAAIVVGTVDRAVRRHRPRLRQPPAALAAARLCRRRPRHAGAGAHPRRLLHPRRLRRAVHGDRLGHLRAVAVLRRPSRRDLSRRAAGHSAHPDRGRQEHGAAGCRRYCVLVLLPQALRQVLPVWINTAVEIVKASTLLSIIGVGELLLKTQEIIGRTFLTLDFYVFAGLHLFPDQFFDRTARPPRRTPARAGMNNGKSRPVLRRPAGRPIGRRGRQHPVCTPAPR